MFIKLNNCSTEFLRNKNIKACGVALTTTRRHPIWLAVYYRYFGDMGEYNGLKKQIVFYLTAFY